jgi:hypothetical protein
MVKRYGDDAMLEASQRADQLLEEGDMASAEVWHWILNAIERLRTRPIRRRLRFERGQARRPTVQTEQTPGLPGIIIIAPHPHPGQYT